MAHLTPAEFTQTVEALAAHFGVEQLRERLAKMNAFTSRRGLNTPAAIAERLHLLSGGLRRQVPATYAFSTVWNELVHAAMDETLEKRLEGLVEEINACLAEDESVVSGKEETLDRALAAYRDALAGATGADVARLDMLLKAVPAVADRLRQGLPPAAAAEPSAGS
jgi:ABC-type transporter Mla subunit MlaD